MSPTTANDGIPPTLTEAPGFAALPNDSIAPARPSASTAHYDLVKQLFREHNRALVKFLLTRLSSEQEARDVAQEAYVRLLQLDQPGAIGFLRGYLFRIAANLSVDRVRHRAVQERIADVFDELADVPGTEHEAITCEEFELACRALGELSPKCRQAFVLHVIEGYRTPEVARTMHIDERTVRKYVTRALVHCRARLGRNEGAERAARTPGGETGEGT